MGADRPHEPCQMSEFSQPDEPIAIAARAVVRSDALALNNVVIKSIAEQHSQRYPSRADRGEALL
jgi:hypothetical protein